MYIFIQYARHAYHKPCALQDTRYMKMNELVPKNKDFKVKRLKIHPICTEEEKNR